MLDDLAQTGIHGILIQDDLVSRQCDDLETSVWQEFESTRAESVSHRQLFDIQQSNLKYTPLFLHWSQFKSKRLSFFLKQCINKIKQRNSHIHVAVNVYYETISAPGHARNWLSQDLEELIQCRPDEFAIMAYQQQISSELSRNFPEVIRLLKTSRQYLSQSYLIPDSMIMWKVQLQDWTTRKLIPSNQVNESLSFNHDVTTVGVPYRGVLSLKNTELGN